MAEMGAKPPAPQSADSERLHREFGCAPQGASEKSGTQAGDPVRAAEAMIRVSEAADPPRHLVLGAWGFETVTGRLRQRLGEIETWRETSLGADYPDA